MFTQFIQECSFVSDRHACLEFFDECVQKVGEPPSAAHSRVKCFSLSKCLEPHELEVGSLSQAETGSRKNSNTERRFCRLPPGGCGEAGGGEAHRSGRDSQRRTHRLHHASRGATGSRRLRMSRPLQVPRRRGEGVTLTQHLSDPSESFSALISYETFPTLRPELFDRPQDQLRVPAKGSAPSSPAPRRTKQVRCLQSLCILVVQNS